MRIENFGLQIDLMREVRFAFRGVPVVELYASGPVFVFRRITGIWDSGAARTLLAEPTYLNLGYSRPTEKWLTMDSVIGYVRWLPRIVYFRIPVKGKPAVHFPVEAGISPDTVENLFGADLTDYFTSVVRHDRVTLLADEWVR